MTYTTTVTILGVKLPVSYKLELPTEVIWIMDSTHISAVDRKILEPVRWYLYIAYIEKQILLNHIFALTVSTEPEQGSF